MLDDTLQKKLIKAGREFTRGHKEDDPYMENFESDQDLHRPQPPLVKPAMTEKKIELTRDFSELELRQDLVELIRDRRSCRVYTDGTVTEGQLSFLLWATQGIKAIRGKSYATIRTVPCGGARHEFETYLLIRHVEGLESGAYHYLPMEHALEFLHPVSNMDDVITRSLDGQKWAEKANVIFYWSMIPYRAEWRYGIYAHRVAMIDVGHVGQNLYLACTGLGLGTCAIGAFSHEVCNELFGLDGEEEYIVYTAPVGTVRESDRDAEQAFYRFVEEEGL